MWAVFVASLEPGLGLQQNKAVLHHYLNHWWLILNCNSRNKLQSNFDEKNKIHMFSMWKMQLKMSVKWWRFCSALNLLNRSHCSLKLSHAWGVTSTPKQGTIYHFYAISIAWYPEGMATISHWPFVLFTQKIIKIYIILSTTYIGLMHICTAASENVAHMSKVCGSNPPWESIERVKINCVALSVQGTWLICWHRILHVSQRNCLDCDF